MKRILTLALAAALLLCGCGGNTDGKDQNEPTKTPDDNKANAIVLKDTTLYIGGNLTADKKEALGEPIGTSEAPSCLYEGSDIIYEYDGFTLQTNQQGEDEILCIVTVETAAYATAKDIKVGDAVEAVKDAYGEAEKETKYYIAYTEDNTALTFSLSDGKVTAIEYAIPS